MYEAFFGLRSRPFSPLPRVDTFVPVAPLREPLASLIRCVEQDQGIGVLTSAAGGGKSLLCRMMFHHFREIRRTVYLTTARFPTRRALLQAILFELKHPYVGLSEQEARLRVLDLLQASPPPMNRMLLIVDEAHLLNAKGLEELRTLTDYEVDGKPAISLILAGQLELEELLTESSMSALNQRIGCHVCIEPLTFEESSQYIRERLRIAGSDGLTVFTPEAIPLICAASEGNPRRLNQLCDHSLLIAFAEEKRPVDESIVRAALLDLRELPLHWNAPLDLTFQDERNPLEDFVKKLDTDTIAFHDGPLADTDTELDLEDGSEFDFVEEEATDPSGSNVLEVSDPNEEHPIDQLFQVEKFIVPSEFKRFDDIPDLDAKNTSADSSDTFSFEPPAAWETDRTQCQPWPQTSVLSDSVELPGKEFECGGELMQGEQASSPPSSPDAIDCFAHKASANNNGAVPPMGFEELFVDDTYAAIDRQCESPTAAPTLRPALSSQVYSPQNQVQDIVPQTCSAPCCDEDHKTVDHLDDTILDETHVSHEYPMSHDFGPSVTPTQSALLETQLLDFINEISQDVRQFREELNSGLAPDTLAGTMDHPAQEVDRLLQLSKRRASLVHYDVVEPERHGELATESIARTGTHESGAVQTAVSEMLASSREPAEPVLSPACEQQKISDEKGRYAQLFTRLQRQRRRVETVMKRTQRD